MGGLKLFYFQLYSMIDGPIRPTHGVQLSCLLSWYLCNTFSRVHKIAKSDY